MCGGIQYSEIEKCPVLLWNEYKIEICILRNFNIIITPSVYFVRCRWRCVQSAAVACYSLCSYLVTALSLCFPSGPPVIVGMSINIASIDSISEVNMVSRTPLVSRVFCFRCLPKCVRFLLTVRPLSPLTTRWGAAVLLPTGYFTVRVKHTKGFMLISPFPHTSPGKHPANKREIPVCQKKDTIPHWLPTDECCSLWMWNITYCSL